MQKCGHCGKEMTPEVLDGMKRKEEEEKKALYTKAMEELEQALSKVDKRWMVYCICGKHHRTLCGFSSLAPTHQCHRFFCFVVDGRFAYCPL